MKAIIKNSNAMYVCLCKAVNDRTIRSCIKGGARSVHDVGRACGAGTDCGSCRGMIREMLEDEVDEAPARHHALPVLSPLSRRRGALRPWSVCAGAPLCLRALAWR